MAKMPWAAGVVARLLLPDRSTSGSKGQSESRGQVGMTQTTRDATVEGS